MRTLALIFCAFVLPACTSSVASVPVIDATAARQLVESDLDTLLDAPTAAHWRRAYRHFDEHLEAHLSADDRLAAELAFASLRRQVRSRKGGDLRASIDAIVAHLQPQS